MKASGKYFIFTIGFLALGTRNASCQVTAHDVVKVYLGSGVPDKKLTLGRNLINATTVNCPSSLATCSLALQVQETVCVDGARWKIEVTVDGIKVPSDGLEANIERDCSNSSWLGIAHIGQGDHVVKLFAVVYADSIRARVWAIDYTVTTP